MGPAGGDQQGRLRSRVSREGTLRSGSFNASYRRPRFIISDQHTPFAELEKRYGDRLPVRKGDWTPYWEGGAASPARETAMNRARADRMTQAETVWALREPEPWPASAADTARKNVLLYTEHTWGAWNSISKPEADFVKEQWAIQRGYAEEEDRLSRALLARASAGGPSPTTFDVVNTLSWPRTDVVRVPPALSVGDDRVLDAAGAAVPAQRLSTGELAVLVKDLSPFAARRYRVVLGAAAGPGGPPARASAAGLENGLARRVSIRARARLSRSQARDSPATSSIRLRAARSMSTYS